MPVKFLISFLIGCVIGAASLFLWLQTTGQLVITPEQQVEREGALPAQPVGVPLPEGPNKDVPVRAQKTPAPARVSTVSYPSTDAVAIPVAGKRREDLMDHFLDRRWGGRPHHAIDIMAARGTPVVAVMDGTVRKLHLSVPGGITLYQTDPEEEWIYYYAHLDSYAPEMVEGRKVRRGEVIGYVGSTGNASDPHLHFGISRLPPSKEWWKGEAVNPYPILRSRGVTVPVASAATSGNPALR